MTPDSTIRIVTDTPPWLVRYGPSLTVVAALIALVGVWLSNRAAEQRRKDDANDAERRRKDDEDAAELRRKSDEEAAGRRERERHRREALTDRIGELLAAADSVLTESTRLRSMLVTISSTTDTDHEPAITQWPVEQLTQAQRDAVASVDLFTAKYHQAMILAPSLPVVAALDELRAVVAACYRVSRDVHVDSTENTDYFATTEKVLPGIQAVAEAYRHEYQSGDVGDQSTVKKPSDQPCL